MLVLLFLGLHILVCAVVGLKLHTKQLETRTLIFPAVLLVPVFGVLILLADLWVNKKNKGGSREISMEKLRIQDAKFKHIEVEREKNANMVVPLEEAIAVNDAKTRRKLLLDILHKNPEEHIELLQRARLSDDTELTHYATTTMMEIQSAFEQNIRELEWEVEVREDAEDKVELVKALRKLRKELNRYIESGLITGNILNIYRRKEETVLERLLLIAPNDKRYYLSLIDNKINQGKLEGVETLLEKALEKWNEDENVYQMFIRYYQAMHQGEQIQRILKEIEEKNIYLSKEGKKWYSFWKNEELN